MSRLLLINPNISDSVSDLIRAEAQRSASANTSVEVLTAPFGVAYIETRFEALIGAYATAQLAAEHHERFDAVIVAAFGDPGLAGLREALPCPVTGLTEAALASASRSSRSRSASGPGIARQSRPVASPRGSRAFAAWTSRWPTSEACRPIRATASSRWPNDASPTTAPRSSCWPARRSPAWRAVFAAGCRCPRSTVCRAPCVTPSR